VLRNLGAIEHHEQFTLVAMKPCEQTVEGDESGLAREDAVEACPQGSLALPARISAIGFEVAIERPDQFTNAGLRFALRIGEGRGRVYSSPGATCPQISAERTQSGLLGNPYSST
jgi:hypothetical protein